MRNIPEDLDLKLLLYSQPSTEKELNHPTEDWECKDLFPAEGYHMHHQAV
jgi:hypothetical protein